MGILDPPVPERRCHSGPRLLGDVLAVRTAVPAPDHPTGRIPKSDQLVASQGCRTARTARTTQTSRFLLRRRVRQRHAHPRSMRCERQDSSVRTLSWMTGGIKYLCASCASPPGISTSDNRRLQVPADRAGACRRWVVGGPPALGTGGPSDERRGRRPTSGSRRPLPFTTMTPWVTVRRTRVPHRTSALSREHAVTDDQVAKECAIDLDCRHPHPRPRPRRRPRPRLPDCHVISAISQSGAQARPKCDAHPLLRSFCDSLGGHRSLPVSSCGPSRLGPPPATPARSTRTPRQGSRPQLSRDFVK